MNSQMESFAGKLAVVTGGGSGMGRALVCQLAAQGCSVAACDWHPDAVAETASLARAGAGSGVLVTSHACDVSDEAQVLRFRDELLGQHTSDHVDLVFANAGIGGAGSFINDSRAEWEHTFAVDWWGVYHCARTFLPLLIASGDGVLVNTSSVNGLWAALGPGMPNTAYSAAKFAVRGFTEALIEDLRSNAPQVRVAVVMPGHVGTDIIGNTLRAHGKDPRQPRGRLRLRRAVPRAGAVMNRKALLDRRIPAAGRRPGRQQQRQHLGHIGLPHQDREGGHREQPGRRDRKASRGLDAPGRRPGQHARRGQRDHQHERLEAGRGLDGSAAYRRLAH
jgi:NAD(P)-dependent dehydrogenase (short-subunit alcohol dehydrogenase family)